MSRSLTSATAIAVFILVATEAFAQETIACDPHRGPANSKIECLTKMLRSLNEKVNSLEAQLNHYARQDNLSDYVRRSELESLLTGYVRYRSSLAINLLTEPSSSQQDGRCLEAYVGEAGVIAHRPCNFDSRKELRWQLLPTPQIEAEGQ
jgi:hypothetical protein